MSTMFNKRFKTVIAIPRNTNPISAKTLETATMCALSCNRNSTRWYADGAMSRTDATAVLHNETK